MTFLHLWLKLHLFYYLTLYFIYMTLKFCSTIGLETTRLQWKTCCNHKGSELELFTTLHCITTCFLRQDHVGKKAIHRFFFCRNAAGVFRTQAHLSWTKITTLHYVCVMTPLAFLSPCKVFPAYKGSDGCPCFSSAAISGSNMGLWAYELNTGQLTCPTGPWVVQGGGYVQWHARLPVSMSHVEDCQVQC